MNRRFRKKCRHLQHGIMKTSLSAHLALFTIGIYLHTNSYFGTMGKNRSGIGGRNEETSTFWLV